MPPTGWVQPHRFVAAKGMIYSDVRLSDIRDADRSGSNVSAREPVLVVVNEWISRMGAASGVAEK